MTTRSIGVLSQCPGQPCHVQSRMDTRRSKGSTNMSQEMYDRQKKITSTKHDFLQEKNLEKKDL